MSNSFLYANNAGTVLGAPINNSTTSITLAIGTGSRFPSPTAGKQFALCLTDAATKTNREICYCTSRTGDVCTVIRGQEGTAAQPWDSGDIAANLCTAGTMTSITYCDQNQSFSEAAPVNDWIAVQPFSALTNGGCIADGTTDTYSELFNILQNAPSGMIVDLGDARNVYAVSQMLDVTSGRDITIIGTAKIKYIGAGNPAAVLRITDAPNYVRIGQIYFDGNNKTLNGCLVQCTAIATKEITFNKTQGGACATDATLEYAVLQALASGGAMASIRPKNVSFLGVHTFATGTHGVLPAYCDGVVIDENCRFENAANHGWEAVRCTNVKAFNWHTEAAGLSSGGVGDGTIGFDVGDFTANLCAGDGAFTIEHNCQDGEVHDFNLTQCFHSAVNISYGSSSNSLPNIKNVRVYAGYATAHASNTTTPGVNCYGSTGAGLSDNVQIYDMTVDGFNRGADYLFQKNGKCEVTLENPTGSGTYVIKGQLVNNCDLDGKCNYQVLDNAYQIISYSGTDSSNCRIIGQVLQAGSTSNEAVITIDGAGTDFIATAITGGALNYINVQAGARVSLINSMGPLAGTPWGGTCNPIASYGNDNSSMDFSVVGTARHFSATNNAGAPSFVATIPPNASPYFSAGDRAFNQAYTSSAPKEWAYSGSAWVAQGNYL